MSLVIPFWDGFLPSVGGIEVFLFRYSSMVEQSAVNTKVIGSSPFTGASFLFLLSIVVMPNTVNIVDARSNRAVGTIIFYNIHYGQLTQWESISLT